MHVAHSHADGRLRGERKLAGQHLEGHDASRVEIRGGGGHQPRGLLRREVADGAETGAGFRQVAIGQPLGDAEIDQSGPAVRVDQDVARFDIAVDITPDMRVVESAPDLLQQLGHVVGVEWRVGGDDLFQRLPAYELHDDVGCAVVFASVVDVDDVRVREGGGGARLAFEASAEAGVGG